MPLETLGGATGASLQARLFALGCGVALCLWTLQKLRKRTLLISICSLLITIGAGLGAFAAFPGVFDSFAYTMGVKYPPLLYLILALLSLLVVTLHLAARLSIVDERCRRMAQEIALLAARERQQGESAYDESLNAT